MEISVDLSAVVAIVSTLSEIVVHLSAKAHALLPYLGVFGNVLIWLGSVMTEVLVAAYLVWRLRYWSNGESQDDEEKWPELVATLVGLILLEVVALLLYSCRTRRKGSSIHQRATFSRKNSANPEPR